MDIVIAHLFETQQPRYDGQNKQRDQGGENPVDTRLMSVK